MMRQKVDNNLCIIIIIISVLLLFIKITLLSAADISLNELEKSDENQNDFLLECPKKDAPIETLRENDMKKWSNKMQKIFTEMHREFKNFLSVESDSAFKFNFKNSDIVKHLDKKVVIWHFNLFIEDLVKLMNKPKFTNKKVITSESGLVCQLAKWLTLAELAKRPATFNENYSQYYGNGIDIASEIQNKISKEWENFAQNIEKNNPNKEICLLQGFAHRIVRNENLNIDRHWTTFARKVSYGIFGIAVGPKFSDYNFKTLTEAEYAEHVKKCDELEYSGETVNKLLYEKCKNYFYRKCLEGLIANWTEFQHFLCYHKNIDNYKLWLYYLMGRQDLYLLEEVQPYIMHIEQFGELRSVDSHYDQFQYRTGSEKAIEFESRVVVRQLLADVMLNEFEKSVRHKAKKYDQFGKEMLKKINKVKKAALALDTIVTKKGVCMLVKLREFLAFYGEPMKGVELLQKADDRELRNIGLWWPSTCDRKDEVDAMFDTQRIILYEQRRKMYTIFMKAWHELSTVRGGPSRLHKFLQMTEHEIEKEWSYSEGQYSDPEVFRSHELLKKHYIDTLLINESAQNKAMKLATDLWVWVTWLEKEILELAQCKTNLKMPRFAIGWQQNRWYYEMMYDQLFDIEKAGEEAEVEKKRQQIHILLQLSKNLVEEKQKKPYEKLKVELRSKKLERLKQREDTAPPNGTMDREWYEIRRKSETEKGQSEEETVQKWLQQRHFEHIKQYLSKCYTFNNEFIKKSLGSKKMQLAQIVGDENVEEINRIALHFFERLQKGDNESSYDADGRNCQENAENLDKKKKSEKASTNDEQQKQFDVEKMMEQMNLKEDSKEEKKSKKSGGTKNKEKTNRKKNKATERKNSLKIELKINSSLSTCEDKTASAEREKSADAKKHLAEDTEIFLTPREQLSDQETQLFRTALNSPVVEQNLNEQCHDKIGIVPKKEKNLNAKTEKEKPTNEKEKAKRKKKAKRMNKKSGEKEKKEEEEEEEKEKKEEKKEEEKFRNNTINGTKSSETTEENDSDMTTSTSAADIEEDEQKEMENIGLFGANENGWKLFLKDAFLINFFQKIFVNSTKLLRRIVAIGCLINEIGHRMEVISKLNPIGDQTMLNELKQLGISPSKWTHKKFEKNWHQIKSDQMSMKTLIKSDQNITVSPSKNSPIRQLQKRENSDKFAMKTLRNILWKHLKMIIKFLDVNLADQNQINDDENEEMVFAEKQIILRKMALAILSERENLGKIGQNIQFGKVDLEQLDSFWHKLSDQMRQLITTQFFGYKFGLDKFNEIFHHFLVINEQIEQDQKLYEEISNFTKTEIKFWGNFAMPLHLQEIQIFAGNDKHVLENENNLLSKILSKNGFGLIDNNRKMQIDQAIITIEQIVKKWNQQAKFVVTGSYQLDALTKSSDIDGICVVPIGPLAPQFFGSEKCEMGGNRRICRDKSLFCQLCLLQNVTTIKGIQSTWVPLIEFTFKSDRNTLIDFDIAIATFETDEQIFKCKESKITYEQSDELSAKIAQKIEKLAEEKQRKKRSKENFGAEIGMGKSIHREMEELKKKLRSLSGFEVGAIIFKKVLAKENRENGKGTVLEIYRTFLLAIKWWAKEHHIYDNKLGFFNGISLSVLVAKVMFLYPMASLPFLIQKFFFTFSTWPWPTPVKLTDLPNWSVLRWNSRAEMDKRVEIYSGWGIESGFTMPIVTPGHIEQNATFNVNKSTAKIIKREMQNAIKIVQNWPNLAISQEEKWENLFKDKNFEEKYSHFIRVTCKAFELTNFHDFCGFVETRIRLQLLFVVEQFGHIQLAHAKQIVEKEEIFDGNGHGESIGEEQSDRRDQSQSDQMPNYQKVWLIGLELDDKFELEPKSEQEWILRLNSRLSSQFDAVIKNAYRIKKNVIGECLAIGLNSKHEKR